MDYTGHTQDVISGGPESNHAANTWITTEEPPELSTSPGASDYSSSILCEDPTTFELLAEFVQPDYSTQYWDPSASSWAWTLPANCPVFENTLLQNTPFTPDYTYFTSSASEAQTTEDRKPRNRRSPASSVASSDSDVSLEQDDGQQQCRECRQKYDNFQSLDKHARETNHRSWACPISDCTKAYVRRDVFLRHRSTHREGGFRCPVCRKDKDKNFKQFKRKDHFKEHMRKCHPSWKSDSSCSQELPSFKQLLDNAEDKHGIADEYTNQQKERFRVIVGSLKDMLSESHAPLIERLEDTVDNLNGSTMEALAENMAGAALLQASLTAAKGC